MTDQGFDEIVSGFYQAAAGSIGWVDALSTFRRSVSAFAIYVHAVDRAQGRISYSYNASDLPAEADLDYVRTYHRIDPRGNLALDLEPGQWINCWDIFDDEFVAKDRFYQEFLIPYGGRYVSGAKLIDDGPLCVILGVHRGLRSERLNPDEIAVCRRLARHLADALRSYGASAKHRHEQLLGTALLERLRAPVALLDDERRVLHANPAATALLAKHCAASISGGLLHCSVVREDAELLVALRRLLWDDSSRHGGPPCDKIHMRAHSANGDDSIGLALHALRPDQTLSAFGDRPLAMALFHRSGARLELDPFMVAAAFDLTPGEARVAVAAAAGFTAESIALQNNVSVHTVRSQFSAIFAKTGADRQADLVSLLADLPML